VSNQAKCWFSPCCGCRPEKSGHHHPFLFFICRIHHDEEAEWKNRAIFVLLYITLVSFLTSFPTVMDSKILYTNDDAEIQCVAVKPIETVQKTPSTPRGGRRSPGAANVATSIKTQRTPLPSADDVIFLLPHESLYSYLYIGAADGTLLALRFHVFLTELAVPGGGRTYEHRVVLEAQSKVVITVATPPAATSSFDSRSRLGRAPESTAASLPTTSTATGTSPVPEEATMRDSPATDSALCGVRAIHAPVDLPYLFVLVHGSFRVHEDDTLQLLGPEYTAPLSLAGSTVLLMCVGEEQSMVSRQRRPPVSSAQVFTPDGGGERSAGLDLSTPFVHYALLLNSWTVVLVECTKTSAKRLAFLDDTAGKIGWSDEDIEGTHHASLASLAQPSQQQQQGQELATQSPHAMNTLLSVRPYTSTMAWCGDVLITGSPDYYCVYDTLRGTVLSQLEVSSLLGGCPPYTAYIRGASMDPTRSGFELATESAEVCSYSGGSSDGTRSSSISSSSSSTSSRSSSSDSSSNTRSSSSSGSSGASSCESHSKRESSITTGWPSALVFRLRDGELHVCGGADRADLTAATPLTDAFGGVCEVHSCPPFLLCQRGGCCNEVCDADDARSCTCANASSQQQLSTKLSESRRSAKLCEVILFSCLDGQQWRSPEVEPASFMSVNLRGVRAFPLGLLGVSRHMVEALLWKPFAVQLEDQIETGHYARVLRFVSQCFRGSEAARRVVLRRVCQASAAHAMSRRRYRVAFYFHTLAETGVDSLLRLFPELRRPSATLPMGRRNTTPGGDDGGTSLTVDGGHAAVSDSVAASAAKGDGRNTTFAERNSRQLSYTSSAPYRSLYRILLSQFFALVTLAKTAVNTLNEGSPASPVLPTATAATATTQTKQRSAGEPYARSSSASAVLSSDGCGDTIDADVAASPSRSATESAAPLASVPITPTASTTPHAAGGMAFPSASQPTTPAGTTHHGATPTPSWLESPLNNGTSDSFTTTLASTRANIEFALFCLFAIDCGGARRLRTTRDELLQFMVSVRTLSTEDCTAVMTALGLPPQSLLTTMLVAATGDYNEALTRCQQDVDVAAAGATLAMYARKPDATGAQLERLYHLHLPWMLAADPSATVQLLTTPSRLVLEKPGPAALLPILLTVGGTVLLDYLSYLINTEGSVDAAVHQLYVTHLIHTLQALRDEWGLQGFASEELGAAGGAGTETGLVGRVRRALLSFLQCSLLYDKERVLAALVEADLYEEQCVVLEGLEDHIGVLTVMVYSMKDMGRAVRYCEAHYAQDRSDVHQWVPLADILLGKAVAASAGAPASPIPHGRSESANVVSGASSPRPFGAAADGALPSGAWAAPAARGIVEDPRTSPQGLLGETKQPFVSKASVRERCEDGAGTGLAVLMYPSCDCRRVALNEAAAMAHYTHEGGSAAAGAGAGGPSADGKSTEDGAAAIAIAPSRVAPWHPIMRFNQYLHMLLHVLLVPPKGSTIALPEIVWLLGTHSPYMNPRLVLSSLPGDVALSDVAPYLIRAFQRLELNCELVHMEAAAVQSALVDAVRRHVTLQQRCVWMDEHRRCVVCGELLERGGLVVVFPNLKPAHFRCHHDGTLDPERAVPFFSSVV
jgi:hypothetical protein